MWLDEDLAGKRPNRGCGLASSGRVVGHSENGVVVHLLERHPAQRFKVFRCGEGVVDSGGVKAPERQRAADGRQ